MGSINSCNQRSHEHVLYHVVLRNLCFITESLAYLTAATHGLDEEAGTIAESLQAAMDTV